MPTSMRRTYSEESPSLAAASARERPAFQRRRSSNSPKRRCCLARLARRPRPGRRRLAEGPPSAYWDHPRVPAYQQLMVCWLPGPSCTGSDERLCSNKSSSLRIVGVDRMEIDRIPGLRRFLDEMAPKQADSTRVRVAREVLRWSSVVAWGAFGAVIVLGAGTDPSTSRPT